MKYTIDTKIWTTPAEYAKELNKGENGVNTVLNWIVREKIETMVIPELGLTLVKRGSETVRGYSRDGSKKKRNAKKSSRRRT
jgi:hypothetical protein